MANIEFADQPPEFPLPEDDQTDLTSLPTDDSGFYSASLPHSETNFETFQEDVRDEYVQWEDFYIKFLERELRAKRGVRAFDEETISQKLDQARNVFRRLNFARQNRSPSDPLGLYYLDLSLRRDHPEYDEQRILEEIETMKTDENFLQSIASMEEEDFMYPHRKMK